MIKSKKIFLTLLMLLLVGAGVFYWKTSGHGSCEVCERPGCKALSFQLKSRWGLKVNTCCPRCGIRYQKKHEGITISNATDFSTGKHIDAAAAVYVEGSDVKFCQTPKTIQDEIRGCCIYPKFDRCLPSLIAFKHKGDAQVFRSKHGGRYVSLEKLINSL